MLLLSSTRRLAQIAFIVFRHAHAHAIGILTARWPKLAGFLPSERLSGPERLRLCFEQMGGTFIKFGQMLALQPDLISLEYCNALFNLLDRVAPFGFDQVERIFAEDKGQLPSEAFDDFEPEPIATASIGQVHAAYLDGRKLAVKVQRPNAKKEFIGDIRLMSAAIWMIKRLGLKRFYWLVEPMGEFVSWTHEELDYRYEARYMNHLRDNARNNPCERIPEVVWDYTTSRVLTVEFLDGVTVLDYIRAVEAGDELMMRRLKSAGFDADVFSSNIIGNFLNDAFRHGMFHADLHPANLMILPGNVVGYLDFGITAVLSHYSRRNLIALTLALVRADTDGMCEPFFNVSTMDAETNLAGFREGLKRLEGEWYEAQGSGRRLRINITMVMLSMLKLSRKTGVWPERDVVKYVRSAIAADGLITRLAPGFNLDQHLAMICDRYLKWQARRALFSYDSLINWSSSASHLMRDGAFRAAGLLDRMADGEIPARVETSESAGNSDSRMRVRVVQLAAMIFVVSLLVTVAGEKIEIGANLFTAEMMLVAAGAMMLFRSIRRLT